MDSESSDKYLYSSQGSQQFSQSRSVDGSGKVYRGRPGRAFDEGQPSNYISDYYVQDGIPSTSAGSYRRGVGSRNEYKGKPSPRGRRNVGMEQTIGANVQGIDNYYNNDMSHYPSQQIYHQSHVPTPQMWAQAWTNVILPFVDQNKALDFSNPNTKPQSTDQYRGQHPYDRADFSYKSESSDSSKNFSNSIPIAQNDPTLSLLAALAGDVSESKSDST